MAYKLKKGIFNIKCDEENCPFDLKLEINNTITGISEEDVESEAKNFFYEIARLKHDELYSGRHALNKKNIEKVSIIYEAVDSNKTSIIAQKEHIKYKEYKKGDIIIGKDDIFYCICEVVKGFANQNKNKSKTYNIGDNFGPSELIINQERVVDIIAGEDGTTIAFYNLKELGKKDPSKAKELYNKSMEDVFEIISSMEEVINKLESTLEKETNDNKNKNELINYLKEKAAKDLSAKTKK